MDGPKKYVRDRASKEAFIEILYFNHPDPQLASKELVTDMLDNKKFLNYSEEEWQPFFQAMKHQSDLICRKCDNMDREIKAARANFDRSLQDKESVVRSLKSEKEAYEDL